MHHLGLEHHHFPNTLDSKLGVIWDFSPTAQSVVMSRFIPSKFMKSVPSFKAIWSYWNLNKKFTSCGVRWIWCWFHYSLAVWSLASDRTFMPLGFLIYTMETHPLPLGQLLAGLDVRKGAWRQHHTVGVQKQLFSSSLSAFLFPLFIAVTVPLHKGWSSKSLTLALWSFLQHMLIHLCFVHLSTHIFSSTYCVFWLPALTQAISFT